MHGQGSTEPSGALGLRVIRAADARDIRDRFERLVSNSWPSRELSLREIVHYGLPRASLDDRVNTWRINNFRHLVRGARKALAARALKLSNFYGTLYLDHIQADGEALELGLASMRVVTTAGVGFIVDAFQNLVELEIMKFHGIGTGGTAESSADTALVTESTTALNPDSTRATGTTTETSSNIYRTVGTNTVDASVACTEHGIFSVATTGSGVLLDRSLFSVVNLASGDSLQSTYDLTLTAGG
jgi:hypothetical protein